MLVMAQSRVLFEKWCHANGYPKDAFRFVDKPADVEGVGIGTPVLLLSGFNVNAAHRYAIENGLFNVRLLAVEEADG